LFSYDPEALVPALTSFTFKQTLAVPPAEAFRMFVHATALRDWLADSALADARPGGVIHLHWDNGHYVAATIQKLAAPRNLTLIWDGKGDPEPTRVSVTVRARGEGSQVTLVHRGIGAGVKWARTRAWAPARWPAALENLKSVVESGIDLRQARRPRLGIVIPDHSSDAAWRLSAPGARGVLIEGTAEGTGARALGWQKGDVLVRLGGKSIADLPSLGAALEGHQAGEKVAVTWYRGPNKMSGQLELGRFPSTAVPGSPAELAAVARGHYEAINAEWATLLAGAREAETGRPAGEGWSAKELIAHFILCERDYQSWIADMLNDSPVEDSLENRPNVSPRIKALTARLQTTASLMAELRLAQIETLAVLEHLPPALAARPHVFRRIGLWALEMMPSHFHEEHGEQIRAALAAARGR
jgi:uncharacterized protein YndB with AHSA1/START domain